MMMKKIAAAALASASILSLSGCLTFPGAFTSDVTILKDGSYSFAYTGEVNILTLAMMIEEEAKAKAQRAGFTPYCYGSAPGEEVAAEAAAVEAVEAATEVAAETVAEPASDEAYGERECTPEETEQQRAEYAETQARNEKEAKEMKALMGGIDPADPESIADFADRLERQAGWETVQHVAGGTFNIVYKTSGQLPANFGFPLIPDFPTGQPFLTIAKWDNGQTQVSAPGFTGQAGGSGGSTLGMMAAIGGGGPKSSDLEELGIKPIKGTFTVRTDGEILTNNTEKGPKTEQGLKVMRWKVTPESKAAPTTLIQF